jgi:hypothetical protein
LKRSSWLEFLSADVNAVSLFHADREYLNLTILLIDLIEHNALKSRSRFDEVRTARLSKLVAVGQDRKVGIVLAPAAFPTVGPPML